MQISQHCTHQGFECSFAREHKMTVFNIQRHFNNYLLREAMSLTFEQSKSVPTSLLNQVSVKNEYDVWFSDGSSDLFKVSLSSGALTVSEAIKEIVQSLNMQYNLNLQNDVPSYELYGAKKNGKKKSDFPSLEYEQVISQTKLKRFSLLPLYPMKRKESEESTQNSIQSTMDMSGKSNKKQQKSKKGVACFFCG